MNTSKTKIRLLAYFLLISLLALLVLPLGVHAQGINLEWSRWDAQITVQPNNVLNIVETQSIQILEGTIRRGARVWTADIEEIQAVRVVTGGSSIPQALIEDNSDQPGTYSVSRSDGRITLNYVLPKPQNAGGQFTVQITYVTSSPTDGVVDWRIVPGEHDFAVLSSTARIIFPEGDQPDASLIRSNFTDVDVTSNGNELILKTRSELPAGQSFSVQIPYGEGVGAAGDGNTVGAGDDGSGGVDNGSGSGSGGVVPGLPTGGDGSSGAIELPSIGVIALLCCGAVVLLLLGGGGLLSGLLRMFLGGGLSGLGGSSSRPTSGLGGLFGDRRSSGSSSSNPFGSSGSDSSSSSGSGRGFQRSADQDRSIGKTGDDKDSGGGASFS